MLYHGSRFTDICHSFNILRWNNEICQNQMYGQVLLQLVEVGLPASLGLDFTEPSFVAH